MRGHGFLCDSCGTTVVTEDESFAMPHPVSDLPHGWIFMADRGTADPGAKVDQSEFCSWRCAEAYAKACQG